MFWTLDERTRLAGCHMVRDAVERIILEEGVDRFKQFVREVIEEGRRTFIRRIKEMAVPGKYTAPGFVDLLFKNEKGLPDYAAIDTLSHAPLELTIGGNGEFHISFDGASKWGYHSL